MTGLYIVTQVVGGMVGVWAANVRTAGLAIVDHSAYRTRTMAEAIATFGLGHTFPMEGCRDPSLSLPSGWVSRGLHHFRHRGARAFGHVLRSVAVHHFGLLVHGLHVVCEPGGLSQ
jgi:hypothetical protein